MQVNFRSRLLVETPLPQPLPTYYPNVLALAQAQPITVNRGETMAGVEVMLAEGMPTVVTGTVLRSDGAAGHRRVGELRACIGH